MTTQKIEQLYPKFERWVKERYVGFGDHRSTLKMWYEWLKEREKK